MKNTAEHKARRAEAARKKYHLKLAPRSRWDGKPPSTYLDDCKWALANAAISDVKPQDSPSPDAWFLMVNLRGNPALLREPLMLMAKKTAEVNDAAIDADLRRSERELDEAIDKVEAAALA